MRNIILCFLLLFISFITLAARDAYYTDIKSNLIKTLQVKVAGELISQPIIELNGEEQIEINFDALGHEFNRFAYSMIHCNADWTQSSLSSIEYINGFQGLTIDDFATSINTTTQYTNYLYLLPNDDVQFKVSGNYALQVFKEDEPDKILFTACFSVVEPLVSINAGITSNTMIDANRSHQQVNFTINHKGIDIAYPQSDLKIYVSQNNRRDNVVNNLKPTSILNGQLVYDNNRDLIFKAGNEYRRIEFLSTRYAGMGVNDIQFHNPYYHIELQPDLIRSNQSYHYDQDQNGRFFIRCSGCNDPDTEADYCIVHFSLVSEPFLDGSVYLTGQLTNNVINESNKMSYNFDTGQYELSLLLKQGSYNYEYLVVKNNSNLGQTAETEGDYYQTENEYAIAVYFRPMGVRYDRLIGAEIIRNAVDTF